MSVNNLNGSPNIIMDYTLHFCIMYIVLYEDELNTSNYYLNVK